MRRVCPALLRRVSNVGQIVLLVMVLFVIVDIVLRRFFNSPLAWSLEVIQVMLVVVVFFSVAHTGSRRGHVSVDLFISKLPAKSQTIIDCFTYILGIVLFVFMGWGSYLSGMQE